MCLRKDLATAGSRRSSRWLRPAADLTSASPWAIFYIAPTRTLQFVTRGKARERSINTGGRDPDSERLFASAVHSTCARKLRETTRDMTESGRGHRRSLSGERREHIMWLRAQHEDLVELVPGTHATDV